MTDLEDRSVLPPAFQASGDAADQGALSAISTATLDCFLTQGAFPVACLDRAFTVLWVNDAYAARGRRPRAAYIGKNHFDLYPDAETEALFRRVLTEGTPLQQTDRPFHDPDQPQCGPTYWVMGLTPVRDADGGVVGLTVTLIDVTSRKARERATQRLNRRLTQAARAAGIGVWEWNLDTGALVWDEGMFLLYGVDPASFCGRFEDWQDRAHPEDLPRVLQAVERTAQEGAPFDMVFRIVRSCGTLRHIRALAERQTDPADGTQIVVGVNFDVTEHTDLQHTLDKIVTCAPGVFYQYRQSQDGSIEFPYISPGVADLCGVTVEAVSADALAAFSRIHPEDLPVVQGSIAESFHNLTTWSCEFRVQHPEKGEVWVSGRSQPEREAGGSVLWHGFLHDATDRKRDETIRDALATVVNHSDDIFVVKDLNLRVVATNHAFARASGNASVAAMLGKTDAEIFGVSPESEPVRTYMTDDLRAQTLPRGGIIEREEPVVHPDGTVRTVLTRKGPIFDRSGRLMGTGNIAIDITERKAIEGRLRRSNAELEQFAYVASHDLRQPLRTITSFVQLLERSLGDSLDARSKEFMGFVQQGARHMDALLADLLEYARIGRDDASMAPVDTREVLDKALFCLQPVIAECQATIDITAGPWPTLPASATDLIRLFQNLIDNALKYRRPDHPLLVELGVRRSGADWLFWVQDSGIGIDPVYGERVFMIFQRLHTKDAIEGTGIGLAMCRKIVDRHGGRIWLDSAGEGHGATVYFTLPDAPGA